jgi:dipeptidyl aminopeptidase/acylaminoacyl peptidase
LVLVLLPLQVLAQNSAFSDYKSYPFPTELHASSKGSKIVWAFDEQGIRNVYAAEGPEFKPRKLTAFSTDDGQEITSLSISDDGQWVVFVRGGDHGSNWDDELPLNPTGDLNPFKVQIASIPFTGGELKYLSEGDYPVIAPSSKTVSFIKGNQVWSVSIDGSSPAKNLFTTRGKVNSIEFNASGSLLFVADRTDHALIGVYTNENTPLKWIAPSFGFDSSPRWSPEGDKIVFVRTMGASGPPDSLLVKKHRTWSIYTAEIATNKATLIWKAPTTLQGSIPTTHGGFNLHWAANNKIVFLSYQDGWPHLYSVPETGGKELLLTPGNFMCEHITLSADKKSITFSANTGSSDLDIEKRHAAKVSVDKADMQVLTNGSGLEWNPVLLADGTTLAFISATAQRPPLPAVMKITEKKISVLCEDKLAPNFPQTKLVTPQQVIFKAADGVIVHADLFMPKNATGKSPAIVYVHGGPPRQMLLGWHYSDYYSNAYASNQYLASLGFVVLSVNYRLGIGYGYDFHQAPKAGISGASEYLDIKAAGEWLQGQRFVDANKIGIYGGSYGGYLTAMALAKDSKIFAAGVDIHGVHNWATRVTNLYTGKYEKAPDFELACKTAWYSSPVAYISTWTSPVLIIHADDDRNVEVNQSIDLVGRLDKKGVRYETLMIIDDSHHWMKWSNATTVYSGVADYFVRKLNK